MSPSALPAAAVPLAAAVVVAVAACGDPEPTPELAIGTGDPSGVPGFVPFAGGAELPLVAGSQGGFHVFVNLRLGAGADEVVTDRPLVRRVARRAADGALVSRVNRRELLNRREDAGLETDPSLLLILCPTPVGVGVAGELIELEVEVAHPSGAPGVAAETALVPVCPEGQDEAFCSSICEG